LPRLAAVERQDPEVRDAVGGADEDERLSIRREVRRSVLLSARHLAQPAAVAVDDPDGGRPLRARQIGGGDGEGERPAVGRQGEVADGAHFVQIFDAERALLGEGADCGEENCEENCGSSHGARVYKLRAEGAIEWACWTEKPESSSVSPTSVRSPGPSRRRCRMKGCASPSPTRASG